MEQSYKYFAFISYNSKDTEWGKRVQRKLEHYRMPATLCSEHGWQRTPIRPVFFAPTDIQPGGLTAELQERLRASRNLIVICSPNSARSEWVGREIEYFHQLGRTSNIHFFIVDGTPHSGNPDTECFNPAVDTLGLPEILGANIHEKIFRWPWLNRERAYVQLVSKLLGIEFDTIWKRHRRLLIQKAALWATMMSVVLVAWVSTILSIIPFTATITAQDTVVNTKLPDDLEGVATLYIGNEVLTDSICSTTGKTTFPRIPHRYLNKAVRLTLNCKNRQEVDTQLVLTEKVVVPIRRLLSVYGHIHFRLWSIRREQYIPDAEVTVSSESSSFQAVTDADGLIDFQIPLELQRPAYQVSASVLLETGIIYMPNGEDDILVVND